MLSSGSLLYAQPYRYEEKVDLGDTVEHGADCRVLGTLCKVDERLLLSLSGQWSWKHARSDVKYFVWRTVSLFLSLSLSLPRWIIFCIFL